MLRIEVEAAAMGRRVLVVEDDEKLGMQIQRFLRQYDFDVALESNGRAAIERIRTDSPDIVVLDIMLLGADGFEVCRSVRAHYAGKILMLTASEDDMDHVAGLEMGADDFLVKPIHPRVLLAHIRVLLRATSESSQKGDEKRAPLVFGGLKIHPLQRTVELNGESVILTPAEFDVLLLLASRSESVVTRDEILKQLRGIEYDGLDRSVDVKISALRKKFKDNLSQPKHIITVRAKGYLFVSDSFS